MQLKGFSLLEFLIALAVASILMLVLWGIHAANESAEAYRNAILSVAQEGSVLNWLWFNDAEQAGFWGYRHMADDYPVENTLCPALLGSPLVAARVVGQASAWHLQLTYLDSQLTEITSMASTTEINIAKTTTYTPGMLIGIADLHQGWVAQISSVRQYRQYTQISLSRAISSLALPAVLAVFHGNDYYVDKAGLWVQACAGKRGLLSAQVHAWVLKAHIEGEAGFKPPPFGRAQIIDAFSIDLLLQSEEALANAPLFYPWQGQMQANTQRRFYQSWPIWLNLGQISAANNVFLAQLAHV